MTTKVMISNLGPDLIRVEVQGRNAKGQFSANYEHYVTPRSFVEVYVHTTQSIQIFEDPNGVTPAVPIPTSTEESGSTEGLQ